MAVIAAQIDHFKKCKRVIGVWGGEGGEAIGEVFCFLNLENDHRSLTAEGRVPFESKGNVWGIRYDWCLVD